MIGGLNIGGIGLLSGYGGDPVAVPDVALLVAKYETGTGPSIPSPNVGAIDWTAASPAANSFYCNVGDAATAAKSTGHITINRTGTYSVFCVGSILYSIGVTQPWISSLRIQRSTNGGSNFYGFDTAVGTPISVPSEALSIVESMDTGGDGTLTMTHAIYHPLVELTAGHLLRLVGFVRDSAFSTMSGSLKHLIFGCQYLGASRTISSGTS